MKTYLRHGPTECFGLINSATSNCEFDGSKAYVAGLEDVLVWDVKKGEKIAMWHETGLTHLVTSIARSPVDWTVFAVGYSDGSVRLWSSSTQSVIVTFNGHKSEVTCLAWDLDGARLASGAKDTDIILWDVAGEEGLYRLRGHTDQVTCLQFMRPSGSGPATHLLSASKDTLLKIFDLAAQACVETLVGHRNSVWAVAFDATSDVIISGGSASELRCWQVDSAALAAGPARDAAGKLVPRVLPIPSISLLSNASAQAITQITLHPTLPVLGIKSGDNQVEIFRLRSEAELRKRLARKRRRERERGKTGKAGKGAKAAESDSDAEGSDADAQGAHDSTEVTYRDRLALWSHIRSKTRVKSFAFAPEKAKHRGDAQVLVSLANNALEVFTIPKAEASLAVEPVQLCALDLPGHRADIRALAVASDDSLLASASNGALKLWNIQTTQCIRTLACGKALCCTFLPGDKHIVVGTQEGELLLYDLAAAALLETFSAHTGPVRSIHVRPDGRGLVSGSGDSDIKFWDFEVRHAQEQRVLTMAHVRTLKMTDEVFAVRYSPDGKLLAVSLLDCTVKVFHADTLKFFLSLYGHKLPVLSLDISFDSRLIITCSADKNIKIWGLAFGDCHRSLFAHEDAIMQVAFERGSHYFWSVSKDRMLKYWDADAFECIQRLKGHSGEVWALAVSARGNFVVTAARDKSIRLWEKTDDPLFIEEERERELEELHDENDASNRNRLELRVQAGEGEDVQEAAEITKTTAETLMAGERILEALDIAETDMEGAALYAAHLAGLPAAQRAAAAPQTRNPIFSMYDNCGPHEYVFKILKSVPATHVQDALLVLPFDRMVRLIGHLDHWIQHGWDLAFSARVLFFLLRTHHAQIVATRSLQTVMLALKSHLRAGLLRQKATIGYNIAGLSYMQRMHEANKTFDFFEGDASATLDEAKIREQVESGLKKRKRVVVK